MVMQQKLFMVLLGCRPAGRHTEQHDVYFGIGTELKDLIYGIGQSWPGSGSIHIDAWREVTVVNGYSIRVEPSLSSTSQTDKKKPLDLFFLNLGGYKANEFEEFHYKMLVVADAMDTAKTMSKQTAFFKHTGLPNGINNKNARAHIDDKYGIDVDDAYRIKDMLSRADKEKHTITIVGDTSDEEDVFHLGYLPLKSVIGPAG